ncbi:MAG: oligosaccharide flippase family protein [Elusimicrobiales bacterium]|nr:oligosaccharide flippase family protein [Elusimicrobiales bacterium]
MIDNLKQKTIKGLFWSFADSFGIYFVKFGFSIAIARALMPNDYGLVGMIAIFIAISEMLIDSGFLSALVQKKILMI